MMRHSGPLSTERCAGGYVPVRARSEGRTDLFIFWYRPFRCSPNYLGGYKPEQFLEYIREMEGAI